MAQRQWKKRHQSFGRIRTNEEDEYEQRQRLEFVVNLIAPISYYERDLIIIEIIEIYKYINIMAKG